MYNDESAKAEIRPRSQISGQVDEQKELVVMLVDVVGELENRLSPVLIGNVPKDIDKSKEEQSLVPLASELMGSNRKINNAIGVLKSVLDRLEI